MTQKINEQNLQRSRQEIEAHLITKAWKDESFKQELFDNSKAVIEKEFGVQLPEQLNVRVMEEDTDTLYITLPMSPDLSELDLSDQELESVAGGITPTVAAGAGIASGIAGAGVAGISVGKEW